MNQEHLDPPWWSTDSLSRPEVVTYTEEDSATARRLLIALADLYQREQIATAQSEQAFAGNVKEHNK